MSHLGDAKGRVYENTNGVPLAEGKTLHMDLSKGQAANRILTVGAAGRARLIAKFLDPVPAPVTITSGRGFETISGCFKGTPISIVAIGMGAAMMDFFVREVRAIVDGPIAIIRYGTCGGLSLDALPGTVVCATQGSSFVSRNYDFFLTKDRPRTGNPYVMHEVSSANLVLSGNLASCLKSHLGAETVVEGQNVTCDSFYSSQGRIDPSFYDENESIIGEIIQRYPDAKSMEMETFILMHLANCSSVGIAASAAAIVLSNRNSGAVVDGDRVLFLEEQGGLACLEALIAFSLN